MSIIHWQPWQEIDTMRRQFDRLFDDLAPVTRDALVRARSEMTWTPAIELKDAGSELVLRAELPGIDSKDLDVQVSQKAVSISGEYRSEKNAEEAGLFRSEFRYGTFRRVVPLPFPVQNDQVSAEFTNGILTLTLPKVEAERPKVVKVTLTEAQAPAATLPSTNAPEVTAPEVTENVEANPTVSETPVAGDLWDGKA